MNHKSNEPNRSPLQDENSAEVDQHEERLAVLFSELTDRLSAGEAIDLEETCRLHPEFEDDLRDLWGTLMLTDGVGAEQRAFLPPTTEHVALSLPLPYELNEFRLDEEIGRGGMGIVYRATRMDDGAAVAIKIMLKGEFASKLDRMRFEAEAEAASGLDHPYIVPIYEIGSHQGRPFFCMKFIEGQTLAQVLAKGPIPSERAAMIAMRICEGIHHANEKGVLHRDLKPSNIMLDEDDTPYICDFGLAKSVRDGVSLTKTGAVIGTPSYMAPEQAAGARGQVSSASEVYSIGAILYHMLTGRAPFMADTPVDTVLMVLEQDPIPPRALNRRADKRLEMITLRCLQKPQDLRYSTAAELGDDLARFLKNEQISAQEGRFGQVLTGLFRETHNASILENWGELWMWHSLVVLVACLLTNIMFWVGVTTRVYYELMWGVGLAAWAGMFWYLRRRRGPVTFLERQIAHVWAANVLGVVLLFPFEGYLGLPLLSLAPILSLVAAMTFLVKAGMLSGIFYVQTAVLMVTAVLMAAAPDFALTIFGVVCSACFYFPGRKYRRQRLRHSPGPVTN
ncbi:MAG: serine/threonine-protein kinase [Pirellulaceae bacterium]